VSALRASRDCFGGGNRDLTIAATTCRPSGPDPKRRRITFAKRGTGGVDIETQRNNEMTWTHLAFDSFSPYIDNRPPLTAGQSEQRRYRLRYRDSDVPVGLFSDTLSVTVGP
jgi:hypothetical protein